MVSTTSDRLAAGIWEAVHCRGLTALDVKCWVHKQRACVLPSIETALNPAAAVHEPLAGVPWCMSRCDI